MGLLAEEVVRTDPYDAAMAEAAVGAFLRRCERQKRDPDLWESWHVLMALQAFGSRMHRETIQCIGAAVLAPRHRPPFARRQVTKHSGVRLAILQALFEAIRSVESKSAALHLNRRERLLGAYHGGNFRYSRPSSSGSGVRLADARHHFRPLVPVAAVLEADLKRSLAFLHIAAGSSRNVHRQPT